MPGIFGGLKAAGDFRRRHMHFIRTLEDLDLIREIALAQTEGRPLSLKQLFTHGIASVATVQRRLARLKRLGVVVQARAPDDKRVLKLKLSPAAIRLVARWARNLRKA